MARRGVGGLAPAWARGRRGRWECAGDLAVFLSAACRGRGGQGVGRAGGVPAAPWLSPACPRGSSRKQPGASEVAWGGWDAGACEDGKLRDAAGRRGAGRRAGAGREARGESRRRWAEPGLGT